MRDTLIFNSEPSHFGILIDPQALSLHMAGRIATVRRWISRKMLPSFHFLGQHMEAMAGTPLTSPTYAEQWQFTTPEAVGCLPPA